MKKFLLLQVLFISLEGSAQTADTIDHSSSDPTLTRLQKINDSLLQTIPSPDSITIRENIDRNITGLLELQKERRAKEKRGAMIRIGIGIALLIVLIIGLRRKSGKNRGDISASG